LTELKDPANARQDRIGQAAAAIWVNDGLELEDEQYVDTVFSSSNINPRRRSLLAYASTINAGSTERERILLTRRRETLHQRYTAWKGRFPFEVDAQDEPEIEVDDLDVIFEEIELPLPSRLVENGAGLIHDLRQLEKGLRVGQADDALKQLRKALALRLVLQREARKNHGPEYFRSQAAIKRADKDIDFAADRYRAAYLALTTLGMGEESRRFKPLTPQDFTMANVFKTDRPLGRGYETEEIPWIWRMEGVGAGVDGDNWLNEGTYKTGVLFILTPVQCYEFSFLMQRPLWIGGERRLILQQQKCCALSNTSDGWRIHGLTV